jgi:cytochrome b
MVVASDKGLVRIWDPLIRIGHWVLVAAFATAYLTQGEPQWLHSSAGYAIAATVALRIIWGFVGPRRARFADFVTGPGRVLGYLRDLLTGRAERHLGHSPAGGAMTVALLFALAVTALSGMATLAVEEGEGPLVGIVTSHSLPAWAIESDDHDEYGEHAERRRGVRGNPRNGGQCDPVAHPTPCRGCALGQPSPRREPCARHDRRAQAERRMTHCDRPLSGVRPQERRRDAGNTYSFFSYVSLRPSLLPRPGRAEARPSGHEPINCIGTIHALHAEPSPLQGPVRTGSPCARHFL